MIDARNAEIAHERTKCPKCQSKTYVRTMKTRQGEFKSILQCGVCRHYLLYEPLA